MAVERLGRSDRDLERRDLVAEGRPQGIERSRRVGVLAVGLVDEETGRRPGLAAQGDGLFETGLDAGRGIHDEQRPVRGGESLDHLGDEVRVTGRIDQRDPRPVVLERPDREAQRLAALLLLGLEVEVGAAVVHATEPWDRPRVEQQLFRERRLAAAGMADQDDAPKVRQVDALHRHRARRSSCGRVRPGAGSDRGPAMIVGYTPARDVRS